MTCGICAGNSAMERGEDAHAVARLATGYVRLMPNQYFRGSTLFQAKACVPELFFLDAEERSRFLTEMTEVAGAMHRAWSPAKLNYELLGNTCPHLHWFLSPRSDTDPHPRGPIWEDLDFLRLLWTEEGRLEPAARDEMRHALLGELRAGDVEIEAEYC